MNRRYEVIQHEDFYELYCYEGNMVVMGAGGNAEDLPALHESGRSFVAEQKQKASTKES
jgi:hypothetical protein